MRSFFQIIKRYGVLGLKIVTFIYATILCLVIISNLAVFQPNWPFGLFASFSETLIVLIVPLLGALMIVWRRASIPVAGLALLALHPVGVFDDYTEPQGTDCTKVGCLSVLSANLRRNAPSLETLAELTESEVTDLILIQELPANADRQTIAEYFPLAKDIRVFRLSEAGQPLGSAMAILAREPLENIHYVEDGLTSPHFNLRGFASLSYQGRLSSPITIIAAHPIKPDTRRGMVYRNHTLDVIARHIANRQDFILAGDFNMTPWEPRFRDIPGKRAGDPRFKPTWNARDPFQNLTIDHAFIGPELTLVQSDILSDIGSDHFPIRIIVRMDEAP